MSPSKMDASRTRTTSDGNSDVVRSENENGLGRRKERGGTHDLVLDEGLLTGRVIGKGISVEGPPWLDPVTVTRSESRTLIRRLSFPTTFLVYFIKLF